VLVTLEVVARIVTKWIEGGLTRRVSRAGRSDSRLKAQVKLLERTQTLQAKMNTQKARRYVVAVVMQEKAEG
jgi:hypothetical protein